MDLRQHLRTSPIHHHHSPLLLPIHHTPLQPPYEHLYDQRPEESIRDALELEEGREYRARESYQVAERRYRGYEDCR